MWAHKLPLKVTGSKKGPKATHTPQQLGLFSLLFEAIYSTSHAAKRFSWLNRSAVFSELFVMPESIYSIQRHFIGNSTNAGGHKRAVHVLRGRRWWGVKSLHVIRAALHFIAAVPLLFWPFFLPLCVGHKVWNNVSAFLGKRRKRRKLFALSGLSRNKVSAAAAAIFGLWAILMHCSCWVSLLGADLFCLSQDM